MFQPSHWLLAALLASVVACGSSTSRRSNGADSGAGSDAVADAGSAGEHFGVGGVPDETTGGTPGTGGSSGSGGTNNGELPRQAADPTLTRLLVPGRASLLGDTYDSCSNAEPAQGDHWCAFSRVVSDTQSELWVINFTKAAAQGQAACDGSSPDCLLLSSDLWVDFSFWSDSTPVVHRFDGDTLVFNSGPAPGKQDPYVGGIWAWRPGWQKPQLLTDHGAFCFANPRSTAIACVANAHIDPASSDLLVPPYFREFDLLVGVLGDEAAGPLATVTHVTHAPDDRKWRLRFSPDGQYLAYSNVPTLGEAETLKVIQVSAAGAAPPTTILSDVAEWEIAHDGKSVYYLAGYDRSQGAAALGTLMAADFPSGENISEVRKQVRSFELVGDFDRVFTAEDHGVVAFASVPGALQPVLIRQPRQPADFLGLDSTATSIDVSSDLRHSVYFKPVLGNPVVMVARNDGSGACQLTADSKAESFMTEFTASGASVVWIEQVRKGTRSEQGWQARPEDCAARVQFGDHVLDYQLVGDDFVVFQGSDADASSWWLEYTRLHGDASGTMPLPTVVGEHPEGNVHVVRDAAGTWIVFSTLPGTGQAEAGLFVHGPLQP
jgi:hypothetical protein